MVTLGTADEKRFTADVNLGAAEVQAGAWARNAALRLNMLWQDSGVPGRDEVERESRAFAPSLSLGIGTPTRVTVGAQFMRQDNLPDYGIPGAAWDEPLTPTSVLAPSTVDQTNYYGSPGYDYDRADQDTYTARVEHDLTGRMTLRNQTRYNRTHREAVISAIQNVAAYNATTNLVTLARQGNERENTVVVEPDQHRRPLQHRNAAACRQRRRGNRPRGAVGADADRTRNARAGEHLLAESR